MAERAIAAGETCYNPAMPTVWLKQSRRRRIVAAPYPGEWFDYLDRNVRHVELLDEDDRRRLFEFTRILLAEPTWAGGAGLELTDEMRVTVAGQASVLLLGVTDYSFCYDGVRRIVLHADLRSLAADPSGAARSDERVIVLPWEEALHGCRDRTDGTNIVVYSFARRLASLAAASGDTYWLNGLQEEFEAAGGDDGAATLLDRSGLADGTEFFAVATEFFFERTLELRRAHRELYELLGRFYSLSPDDWFDDGEDEEEEPFVVVTEAGDMDVGEPGDEDYVGGLNLLEEGRVEEAVAALESALRAAPDDSEVCRDLGGALLWLERHDEAERTFDRAIALDVDDPLTHFLRARLMTDLGRFDEALDDLRHCEHGEHVAYCRGQARAGLGHYRRAIGEFSAVIRMNPDRADAYRERASAYAALGKIRKSQEDREAAAELEPDGVSHDTPSPKWWQ